MADLLEPPVAPAPTTPSPALEDFDKTFADLDPAPAPEPTPEPAPAPAPERPREPETGKFTAKPEVKPEPAKVEPKAEPKVEPKEPAVKSSGDFEPPQVAKPNELRSWAKRMGTRAETAEQSLSKLNSRIRELESRPTQQGDVKALTDQLAQAKKQISDYEGEIKMTRYERSNEYKEQYEKPYQNAVRSAYAEVGELLVAVPNPNDPDNPTERQATTQDFDEVYQLPLGPATKLAKQKFGDAYTEVLKHRSAIKSAAKTALEAVDAHKGKAAEFDQQQTAQQKMQEEGRARMFGEAVKAITDKYKDIFGERDGDTTWNENLGKGRGMADLAFSDRKNLSPEQSAILDAQVHARVSAFPGLRHENTHLKSEVAKLTKEIADLRGSGPGKTSAAAPKAEAGTENLTIDQAFDKMIPV